MQIIYGLLLLSSLALLARSDHQPPEDSSDNIRLMVPSVQQVLQWQRFLVQNCGYQPQLYRGDLLEEASEKVSEDLEHEASAFFEDTPDLEDHLTPTDRIAAHNLPIMTELHEQQSQLKPPASKYTEEIEFAQKQDSLQSNRDHSAQSSSTRSETYKPTGRLRSGDSSKQFWRDLSIPPINPSSWNLAQYVSVIGSIASSVLLAIKLVSAGKEWSKRRETQRTNSATTKDREGSPSDSSHNSGSSSDTRPTPTSSNEQDASSTPSDLGKRPLSESPENFKHEIVQDKTFPSQNDDTPSGSGQNSNLESSTEQADKFDQDGSSSYVLVDRQTDAAEDLDWQLDNTAAKQTPRATHKVTFRDHNKRSSSNEEPTKEDTAAVDSSEGAILIAKQPQNDRTDGPKALNLQTSTSKSGTGAHASAQQGVDEKKVTSNLADSLRSIKTAPTDEVTVREGLSNDSSERESQRTERSPTARGSLIEQVYQSPRWSRSSSSHGSPTPPWSRSRNRNRWSSPTGTGRTDVVRSPHSPDNCFICIREAQLQRAKAAEAASADTDVSANKSNPPTSLDATTSSTTSLLSQPRPLDSQVGASQTSLSEREGTKRYSFRQALSQVFSSSQPSSQSKSSTSSLNSGGSGNSGTIGRIRSKFSSRNES